MWKTAVVRLAVAAEALAIIALVGCGGGGTPPPPPVAETTPAPTTTTTSTTACSFNLVGGTFAPNDSIPGFVLSMPTGERADTRADGVYSDGTWRVMFTRPLIAADPLQDRDFTALPIGTLYSFSVAVLDNMGGAFDGTMNRQNFGAYTLGNAASAANLKAKDVTLTGAPKNIPGAATWTDAVEWDAANWGVAFSKPAGLGISGTATGAAVTLRASYDATNLYILAVWSDATNDDRKQSWVFNGTTWSRRSDKGTDGSWATIDSDGSQWDEDRLAFWWNISVTDFATGGCQVLCHSQRMGSLTLGEKADLWHWKAARSNPMGFVDDQRLNDGTWSTVNMAGRSNDTGAGIDSNNVTGALPTSMSEFDPGINARYLYTATAPSPYRPTTPFVDGGFNANASISGYELRPPVGGRADIVTVGAWENDEWRVMFTRALATASDTEDRNFAGLATGTLYYFSAAVLDNMGGAFDATMTGQYAGVLTMGDETLFPTANLRARSVTSAPLRDPNDTKWGPAALKPAGSGSSGTAAGAAVTLRAAYDAANIYLLAIWSDSTKDDFKESWVWNGIAWAKRTGTSSGRGNDGSWTTIDVDGSQWDEDRLAIWWDISVTTGMTGPFTTQGCLTLCHQHRMGSHEVGERADLWHWKAARTNPRGFADDQRLNDAVFSGHTMAGRSDDTGTGMDVNNLTGVRPTSMADADPIPNAGDPNANATYLFSSATPTGPILRRAVAFVNSVPTETCVTTTVTTVTDPTTGDTTTSTTGGTPATVSYSSQIDPLLASNCACHRNGGVQNGLNLDSWSNLVLGGASGSEVVAGNGANSLVYQKVSMDTPPVGARMPFGGPYLSATQQQLIKDWIDQGALNN